LHNKPTGCSASGAYALGPDEEDEGLHIILQSMHHGKKAAGSFVIKKFHVTK